MFLNFRYLSLAMVADYQVVEYPRMRLILSTNPALQGKIFKKGILIAMRYSIDSKFSYDLDDIVLGRDRDSINDYEQLKHLQSKLHALVLNDHEQLYETRADIRDLLDSHVEDCIRGLKVNSFRTWYLHSYANASSFNRIYRKFLV